MADFLEMQKRATWCNERLRKIMDWTQKAAGGRVTGTDYLAVVSRQPPPPDQRVGALHDTVHYEVGKARPAKTAKATNNTANLKKCPVCGAGGTVMQVSEHWNGQGYNVLSVEITHRCEMIRGAPSSFLQIKGKTQEEAVETWNRWAT